MITSHPIFIIVYVYGLSGLRAENGIEQLNYVFQQNLFHSIARPGKNSICKVGQGDKCYRWICRDGFKGENCDEGKRARRSG